MPVFDVLSSTEFVASIVGAVVGSTSGGVISFILQRSALQSAKSQKDEERKEAQAVLAQSLIVKVLLIHSGFYTLSRHFEGSLQAAAADGFEGEPVQIIKPLGNIPERVTISPEEKTILMTLGNDQLLNTMIMLDTAYNSVISSVETFNSHKIALNELFLENGELNGELLSTVIPDKKMVAIAPKIHDVSGMISAIRIHLAEGLQDTDAALADLTKLFIERFGLQISVTFKPSAAGSGDQKEAS
jgi:hypothetical protein